jgi:hypothetical protein
LQTVYGKTEHPEWLEMLERVIKESTGVEEIKWKLIDSWETTQEGYSTGYIDHASSAREGQNIQIFESDATLRAFLFGEASFITLDNDNG